MDDNGDNDEKRIRIADLILRLRRVGVTDTRVLSAIESIPRETFVPAESRAEAYSERALPIECGQTISAPGIVGIMTAAGETVPDALLKQVRVGGVIVIPVGAQDEVQKLVRMERTDDGFDEKVLADVRFVPLIPGKAERL